MGSSQALILAGSALLVAGLGYLALKGPSSSTGSTALVIADIDDDADAEGEFISADEVATIFDRLFREMQAILGQLLQQIQAIQNSELAFPDAQLRALLKREMENALAAKQNMILEEFDMDYDCLEQATWEFLEDEDANPQVKTAVNRFQKFWENVSNEEHAGWRPSDSKNADPPPEALSSERLVEVAQVYFDRLTAQMKELVAEYKADGKDLKNPVVQNQLNMDFAEKAQSSGEEALQGEGVTMTQFEGSIKTHAENPYVGRQLRMMQMKQQQELMSIGSS